MRTCQHGDYEILICSGAEAGGFEESLAQLRIEVFREYPYLYEGDAEYEYGYLRPFFAAPDSLLIAVLFKGEVVGASTASPLIQALEEVREPYRKAGRNESEVFYLGESVLIKEHRSQGIGRLFFDLREERARELSLPIASFCAVSRPPEHEKKPADFRPLEPFWRRRGYEPVPGMQAQFPWREVGHTQETEHTMVFWEKRLVASKGNES